MLGVHRAVMYGPDNMWSSEGGYQLFDRYARKLPGVERLTIYSSPAPSSPTTAPNGSPRS